MAAKIRLARIGAKKRPFYRIVVSDERAPRDGRFSEVVGTYDPKKDPVEIQFKEDRVREWLAQGAKPSETVSNLMKKKGIL